MSILNQLQNDDEIILSDDGSTDDTLNIVNSLNDKRIRCYIHNKRKNPWKFIGGDEKCFAVSDNFNYCLGIAKGDYIFLSDQDDIWYPDRVKKTLSMMHKSCICTTCNSILINSHGNIISQPLRPKNYNFTPIRTLIYSPFAGCTLAFDRDFF